MSQELATVVQQTTARKANGLAIKKNPVSFTYTNKSKDKVIKWHHITSSQFRYISSFRVYFTNAKLELT
jgi:hypothetical protein